MTVRRLKEYFFFSLALLLASACQEKDRYAVVGGYAQGGTYTVKMNMRGVRASREEIASGIETILHRIDTTLSGYNKGSILSRYNRGEYSGKDPMLMEIYSMSRRFFEETEGALDVAAGPLFDAWGFGFTTDSLPSDKMLDRLLSVCGMHTLDENMEPLHEGVSPVLNFNAIAQGYTCDKVALYLHSLGIKDMLVDIGEIYCEGASPSGKPWTIGIDRPVDGNMTPGADLDGIWRGDFSGKGIVTSGNYRKYYEKDGKKYSHTIDPRTGHPVSHSLLSATIIAPDAASADAYATYCMVIGLEQARDFILSRPDLEGYLIYDDREIPGDASFPCGGGKMSEWASPGFNLLGR